MRAQQTSIVNATVTITEVTTSGSTTDGAMSVSITNSGAATGTVDSVDLAAGSSWSAEFNGPFNPIAYDATGTTFAITEVN